MFEHRIHDRQQLAHAGHEGHFLGLTRRTQPLIEGANDGIEARGHNRCHVEGRPHLRPAAPDRPLPPQRATIPIEGRHTNKRGDLFVRQRAEFRKVGQQGGGQHGANARTLRNSSSFSRQTGLCRMASAKSVLAWSRACSSQVM